MASKAILYQDATLVRWILTYNMNSRVIFASLHRQNNYTHNTRNPASSFLQTLENPSSAMSTLTNKDGDPDENLCNNSTNGSNIPDPLDVAAPSPSPSPLYIPSQVLTRMTRVERAWAHWKDLGAPRLMVAPMVDNSELPFRMLCRKYGAEAAYTPMLHSRIFSENEKYRSMEFSTCKEDRPLFVQFCANDPKILLESAKRVEAYCDYIDINLGCPQRIARRGYYGAFLMENQPLIKSLVETLVLNLDVPVSCKIRIFPNLDDTISYAKMLEEAGCSLLAVHGRTRDQKDSTKFKADWAAIRAVKQALRIPVLANGNIRHMEDVNSCLEETGVDGVLSAETLLENPALFAGYKTVEWREEGDKEGDLDQADLVVEYLKLCEKYPVPWRMIRSHVHKMLGDWFRVHPEVREELNKQSILTFEWLYDMVRRLRELGKGDPLYGGKNIVVDRIAVNAAAG